MQKETNQPYILTQDTKSILGILDGNLPASFDARMDQYLDELSQMVSLAYPEIITFTEAEMQAKLGVKLTASLEENPQLVCLCLDRFLLQDIEAKFPDRFTRLAITRTADGIKAPRQGNLPIDEQFKKTVAFVQDRQVIITDDGLFSGGTAQFVIDKLYQSGLQKWQVEKIIAFIGDSQILKVDGIPIELIKDIPNLYEWIDIRDNGIFGGKLLAAGRRNRAATAIPYIFPWSQGESASLDKSGQLFNISKNLIQSFISLITDFEAATGKQVTFRDLIKSGFPLPTNREKTIPVSINTDPKTYLKSCLQMVEVEQQREVVILDMDGTLYQLDGQNNGYSGSRLEMAVLNNCQQFIMANESCLPAEAKLIMEQGLKDSIGFSNFLSQRYGISREDYFNIVWNLNPENLITNYQTQAEVIKQLAKTGKKLILLTSGAKIWQQQVISFLGLDDCFESIYTGESFTQKEEIFQMLSERYQPGKIISVGDQEKTDILPAATFGCNTLLIQNPSDLNKLLL